MRKRIRVLFLAAVVAAVIVPVGFALSVDPLVVSNHEPAATASSMARPALIATNVRGPLVVMASGSSRVSPRPVLTDRAKLLVLGGVLFGLAAAVRRAG